MPETIFRLTDSSGQSVVIVKHGITHLVSGGEAHTEVHLAGGTYVRIKGSIEELTMRFWPTDA